MMLSRVWPSAASPLRWIPRSSGPRWWRAATIRATPGSDAPPARTWPQIPHIEGSGLAGAGGADAGVRFGMLRDERTERQNVQVADLEGADGILGSADDRLLVDVEAGVHHAADPRELAELADDPAVVRIVRFMDHLWTGRAVDVGD